MKGRDYLRQCTRLVGTNDRHSSKCFNRLERLAKNLVTLHNVCSDRQRSSESDWQAFRNESDRDGDNVNDETSSIDPVRMTLPEPRTPADNNYNVKEN